MEQWTWWSCTMDLVELHNDRVSRAPPGVILPPTEHWYMVDAMSACAV